MGKKKKNLIYVVGETNVINENRLAFGGEIIKRARRVRMYGGSQQFYPYI